MLIWYYTIRRRVRRPNIILEWPIGQISTLKMLNMPTAIFSPTRPTQPFQFNVFYFSCYTMASNMHKMCALIRLYLGTLIHLDTQKKIKNKAVSNHNTFGLFTHLLKFLFFGQNARGKKIAPLARRASSEWHRKNLEVFIPC